MIVFNIQNLRKNKNISLYKLEKLTHLSRAYLSRLENNIKLNPSMNTLMRIANALDVNVKDLFYTTLDINDLKNKMYKKIDEFGLNSKEVLEISQIIDLLVTLDLKQQNKNKNKN